MTIREFHSSYAPADVGMTSPAPRMPSAVVPRDASAAEGAARSARLRRIIDRHYDFVWRTLRYLGLGDASAEDAAQEVLCVLARRLDEVAPASEMSFLFSTARRVASEARRAARRQPPTGDDDVNLIEASAPNAEELLDRQRAEALLHDVLDSLAVDLRLVFVLFEIEELTLAQVAVFLGIPPGTAASRLRRARESFRSAVRRLQAARGWGVHGGGAP